jgi:hypothetical protein
LNLDPIKKPSSREDVGTDIRTLDSFFQCRLQSFPAEGHPFVRASPTGHGRPFTICISKGGDMNLFDNLFGGQQRQEVEDFVNRYQQGDPSEGYSEKKR